MFHWIPALCLRLYRKCFFFSPLNFLFEFGFLSIQILSLKGQFNPKPITCGAIYPTIILGVLAVEVFLKNVLKSIKGYNAHYGVK